MATANRCFRCKEAAGAYASRDSVTKLYCADCFSAYCVNKCRDQALVACGLPCDTPIAVAVSGGFHSVFLLHQLGALRAQYRVYQGRGKMNFTLVPFMLREDALVLPPAASEAEGTSSSPPALAREAARRQLRADMAAQFATLESTTREQMVRWSFASAPLYTAEELRVFHYEDFLPSARSADAAAGSSSGPTLESLRALLHHPSLPLSLREEVYALVRDRVLRLAAARVAREYQDTQLAQGRAAVAADHPCESVHLSGAGAGAQWVHLATGEGVETCAARALAALVSGRGGPCMANVCGPRAYTHQTATITVRPVGALMNKEVVLYNRLQGLAWGYTPSLSTATSLRSTRRTLETFVVQLLNGGFRTAVFNILHTAAKLEVRPGCVAEVLDPSRRVTHGADSCAPAVGSHGKARAEAGKPMDTERSGASASASASGPLVATATPQKVVAQTKGGGARAWGRSAELSRDRLAAWPPPPLEPTTTTTTTTPATAAGADSVSTCFLCGTPDVAAAMRRVCVPVRPEEGVPSIAEGGDRDTGEALLACHGCSLLAGDLSLALAGAGPTTSPSEGEPCHWTAWLQLTARLAREASGADGGADIRERVGRKGELSAEDRAAFLLPEDDGADPSS